MSGAHRRHLSRADLAFFTVLGLWFLAVCGCLVLLAVDGFAH